ncbi:MAG: glycoside hydrolase family 9 protein, partial [Fibrobacteria bacterium]
KDGSALGPDYTGRLAGGWHDCGDYGKYAETTAYTALILSLGYAIWPGRAPDNYGASYGLAVPDGIPDLLREAKVGADFIYKLYAVSDELGLIGKADMYHSVGTGPGVDQSSWDVPEKQDAQPQTAGGPDRVVTAGIGSNVAGSYAAALAFFSSSWKKRDSAYALKLEKAAIDIYDRIVMKRLGTRTSMPCCYSGYGPFHDDEALAALALWYATGDTRFGYDLLENTAINKNVGPNNDGEFPAGHMGKRPFGPGGWTTDFENGHVFVLYGLAKLILPDAATALAYGISETVRDSVLKDVKSAMKLGISQGSGGTNSSWYPGINVDEPYHGVFTGAEWGFNRYNMGMVNELMMYYDLTGNENYADIGIDNLNYLLGANPYDISFITGCGDRNMQHPHNRAANPEGYNQGGTPYARQVLTGAVMGGVQPGKTLKDEWSINDNSETCIDFAAQTIFPLLILAPDGGAAVSVGKTGKGRDPASAAGRRAEAAGRKGTRDVLGRRAADSRQARGSLDEFILRMRAGSH